MRRLYSRPTAHYIVHECGRHGTSRDLTATATAEFVVSWLVIRCSRTIQATASDAIDNLCSAQPCHAGRRIGIIAIAGGVMPSRLATWSLFATQLNWNRPVFCQSRSSEQVQNFYNQSSRVESDRALWSREKLQPRTNQLWPIYDENFWPHITFHFVVVLRWAWHT